MIGLNQIEYIVGIDLGTTYSGVSIAHVNVPFNIITVSAWDDSMEPSETFFSSIMYSKDGRDTPKCGIKPNDVNDVGVHVDNISQYLRDIDYSNEKLGQLMDGLTIKKIMTDFLLGGRDTPKSGIKSNDVNDVGVYVDNISQYLLDIDDSNEKLGQLLNGLTIKKVMTDYLKYFVQLALRRLQVHDKLIRNEYFQDFVNEEFIYEDITNACYCLVCPTDRQEFMKDCFIEAGIIEKSEAEHRLSFVIKAVVIAHYHLSLDRNETGIQNDQDYFVIDVDDISTGIAKIHAAPTLSLSTITTISDDITQNSLNLDIRFKAYLIENMTDLKLDTSLIDSVVYKFSKDVKYRFMRDLSRSNKFEHVDVNGDEIFFTYAELSKIVFMPFFESISEFISSAAKVNNRCKLFFSGDHGINSYLIEKFILKDRRGWNYDYSIIKYSLEMVSSGAVSSKLNTYKSQTPLSLYNEHISLFPDRRLSLSETVSEKSTVDDGNDAYDFIVGIDFGTTFSGCSYVQLKDNDRKPVNIKRIKTIKTFWPENILKKNEKAPTLSVYNKHIQPICWGEEGRIEANNSRDDLKLLGNFKLFLCPESLENFKDHTNYLELKTQKAITRNGTPINEVETIKIIADYLYLFKNRVNEYIEKEMKGRYTFTKFKPKIRYVLTVPAMWDLLARNTMAEAAIKAGLIEEEELDQLFIISEPEAAALFCMKRMTENFKEEDEELNDTNFIVCDAGGGTVEMATFNLQLNKEEGDTPTTKSNICQIGDGIGDICGSTCLDLRFKNYIIEFYKSFGVEVDKYSISLDVIMQRFVNSYKPNFFPDLRDDVYYEIYLPGDWSRDFTSGSSYMLANGNITLKIKNQDMKEKIFDPIVDRILCLIDHQLNQAEKRGRKINAIIMVGGFSQSRYLQWRIKDKYKGVCHLRFPSEGVAAISFGAVSYALNPRTISRDTARNPLGLMVQTPFIKRLTNSNQRSVNGSQGAENFEKDQLEYFVREQALGDNLRIRYKKNVSVVYPYAAVIAIFSGGPKDANSRYLTKNHVKIGESKIIMPHMTGIDGRLIHFTVSLQIEQHEVSVTIECQDQLINAEAQKITKNQKSSLKVVSNFPYVVRTKRPLVLYSLKNTDSLFNYGRLSQARK